MKDYKIETIKEDMLCVSPVPDGPDEITEELRACLIKQAVSVLHNSFAPFSHYNVAAAVLMSSGKIYTGVNIESALLSCTICAERNAILHAAAQGERRAVAIAIVGGLNCKDKTVFDDYCTPCGVCRQVMRDFCTDPERLLIICAKSEDDYREFTLEKLLPESFGAEDLEE